MLTKELIGTDDIGKKINIISDSKTTKVTSVDSFAGYLKAKINYEMNFDIDLNVRYLDSNAKDAYIVQAADYVANAIYAKYEYGQSLYFDIIKDYCDRHEKDNEISYEHLMDLTNDPDVLGPLSFLRQREIIHYQRFKELRNYYLEKKV